GPGAPRQRSEYGPDGDPEVARLRAAVRGHPCHRCPDREEHVRLARRHEELVRETESLRARVSGRTGTLARTFDRVVSVLEELAYLHGSTVSPAGQTLARVYAESDLVVVECLRRGLWDSLDPAGLAAVVSTLVYESRRTEEAPVQPPPVIRPALAETVAVWAELHELEAAHRLDSLRSPDGGFAWAAHQWASGARLDTVLTAVDLSAGDFVRWCKQTIDLLDQLRSLPDPVADVAQQAVGLLRRGVVAYA
ncbi:MAG: DEAD/DEAH box helicase, partial [Mycobacteriales bacterium]